jgi:hypothetical protein
MIKLVKFPSNYIGNGNIGKIHYEFAKSLLNEMKDFSIKEFDLSSDLWPSFIIDDKIIMFDYHDFETLHHNYNNVDLCLKTQYTPIHKKYTNIFPWSQISFLDWNNFYQLRNEIKYQANNDLILNNQKPYGNAKERRLNVRKILKDNFPGQVSTKPDMEQSEFFKQINNCLVYVHVPGYRNNMLDRGHIQMFAFGCCVITTNIPNILPNNQKPLPGKHYIKCNDNYSDLVELINWCKMNRNKCKEIGNNAKKLFDESLSPKAIENHLKKILKK